MSEKVLEAIRAETERRESELVQWRGLEAAALKLSGAGPAEPAVAGPPPAAPPRSRPALGTTGVVAGQQEAILSALSAGPLSSTAIASAARLPIYTVRRVLPTLLGSRVVSTGERRDRRYALAQLGNGQEEGWLKERPLEDAILDAAGVDSL